MSTAGTATAAATLPPDAADTQPAVAKVTELVQTTGCSLKQIAEAIPEVGVRDLRWLLRTRPKYAPARLVRAVMGADLNFTPVVPASQLQTLVHQLQALGWPYAWVAHAVGRPRNALAPWRLRQRRHVSRPLYDAVARYAAQLGDQAATPREGLTRKQINLARRDARAAGYYPPCDYTGEPTAETEAADRRERRAAADLEILRYSLPPYNMSAAEVGWRVFPELSAAASQRTVTRRRAAAGVSCAWRKGHRNPPNGLHVPADQETRIKEILDALAWYDDEPGPEAAVVCHALGLPSGDLPVGAAAELLTEQVDAGAWPDGKLPGPAWWAAHNRARVAAARAAYQQCIDDGVIVMVPGGGYRAVDLDDDLDEEPE